MLPQNLDQLLQVITSRRATRHFHNTPIADELLENLLEAARWAPSGYNLQPTHFVVVCDAQQRARLRSACMDQPQITEAPAVVVFTGNRQVAENHFEHIIAEDQAVGAMTASYEKALRKFVPLAFRTGPLGLHWLWKATLAPIAQWFTPVPNIPAVQRRYWLAKQASLAAMNFMLAATAAGLATCPMEGFDEKRVRKVLNIPRSHVPILVIPVGHAASTARVKSRRPLHALVHRDRW